MPMQSLRIDAIPFVDEYEQIHHHSLVAIPSEPPNYNRCKVACNKTEAVGFWVASIRDRALSLRNPLLVLPCCLA